MHLTAFQSLLFRNSNALMRQVMLGPEYLSPDLGLSASTTISNTVTPTFVH